MSSIDLHERQRQAVDAVLGAAVDWMRRHRDAASSYQLLCAVEDYVRASAPPRPTWAKAEP